MKSSNSYGSSGSKSGQATTINFSIEDIQRATGNFSPANKIGEGGCGTVYKGKLRDGSVVAVKRAKRVNNYAYVRMKVIVSIYITVLLILGV